jgi:hypothetical protein
MPRELARDIRHSQVENGVCPREHPTRCDGNCDQCWDNALKPYTADPSKPPIIEPEFAIEQEVWTIHCTRKGYVSTRRVVDGFMIYKNLPIEYMLSGISLSAKDLFPTRELAEAECARRNEVTP